jgi:hypothetical protein
MGRKPGPFTLDQAKALLNEATRHDLGLILQVNNPTQVRSRLYEANRELKLPLSVHLTDHQDGNLIIKRQDASDA